MDCQPKKKRRQRGHSLWKDINHTPPNPLVTDATNFFIRDGDMSRPRIAITIMSTIPDEQVRLHLDIAQLAKIGRDAGLVQDRVGRSHSVSKVKLQLLDWQRSRDQFQCSVGRETGSMAREQVERGSVLRLVAMWWFEIQGEQCQVY